MQKWYVDVMQPNDNMHDKVGLAGLTNSGCRGGPCVGSMDLVLET